MTEASRDPGVFSSAGGVTNILNLPAEFNDFALGPARAVARELRRPYRADYLRSSMINGIKRLPCEFG